MIAEPQFNLINSVNAVHCFNYLSVHIAKGGPSSTDINGIAINNSFNNFIDERIKYLFN